MVWCRIMLYIITKAVEARRQAENVYGTFLHIYQTTLRHVQEEIVRILALLKTSDVKDFVLKLQIIMKTSTFYPQLN